MRPVTKPESLEKAAEINDVARQTEIDIKNFKAELEGLKKDPKANSKIIAKLEDLIQFNEENLAMFKEGGFELEEIIEEEVK